MYKMSDYIAGLLKEMEQLCNCLHLNKRSFININCDKQQLHYFVDKITIGGKSNEREF
jgi:hypothetical protein